MLTYTKYIEVYANVDDWDTSTVTDNDGNPQGTPFVSGGMWHPTIRIEDGYVMNWPTGLIASFFYKVCDRGSYYLLDANKNRLASIENDYVPSDFLCHGDNGYGDYIIFNVDEYGFIVNYKKPYIDEDDWELYIF